MSHVDIAWKPIFVKPQDIKDLIHHENIYLTNFGICVYSVYIHIGDTYSC